MWLLILSSVVVVISLWWLKVYRYWIEKGVSQLNPWPIIGNMAPLVFRSSSSAELIQDSYNSFPHKRYYGIHQFLRPTLIIRDPDLIKAVTIKEFDTFPEHRVMLPPDVDPLFSNNLFSLRGGKRWQELRSILTPYFTSAKLKSTFILMQRCAEQCTKYLEKQCDDFTTEMGGFFDKYANDVIGSTAYGVTCNSFENPTNEFFLMGKESTNITAWKSIKLLMYSLSPFIMKVFKTRIVSEQADQFFRSITNQTLKLRKEHDVIHHDVINTFIDARQQKQDVVLTDEDIAANAFIFFLAGFDTTSRALSFTFYELAVNPDIQKKLQSEIDSTLETGEINYEKLNELKYIDMVISEALRMWPPIIFSERSSVKPFTIEPNGPKEKRLHLDHPTDIWIPIYALQRDPKYFPCPDIFDPERFSDANKQHINPFTYLPFGTGPRNCIGIRFALLEMKLIMFYILSKYEIVPTDKTPLPLVLGRGQLFPSVEGGLFLRFLRRQT